MTGSESYILNVIQSTYVISKSKVIIWPGIKIKCCLQSHLPVMSYNMIFVHLRISEQI